MWFSSMSFFTSNGSPFSLMTDPFILRPNGFNIFMA